MSESAQDRLDVNRKLEHGQSMQFSRAQKRTPFLRSLCATQLALALLMLGYPLETTAQETPEVLIVKMVDKSTGQWRFEPDVFTVQLGDTVRFVQDDIVPHNVEFVKKPRRSRIDDLMMGPFLMTRGETYDVVIDSRFKLGKYKFVCTPHKPLGMVGEFTVVEQDQTLSTN